MAVLDCSLARQAAAIRSQLLLLRSASFLPPDLASVISISDRLLLRLTSFTHRPDLPFSQSVPSFCFQHPRHDSPKIPTDSVIPFSTPSSVVHSAPFHLETKASIFTPAALPDSDLPKRYIFLKLLKLAILFGMNLSMNF